MKKLLLLLPFLFITIFVYAQEYPDSWEDGVYYEVNGKKLYTVSFGEGSPLFFIAGGPGGAHPGLRSFDPLSSDFTLVYFDGYGRGKSDTADVVTDYSIEGDIDDLEGLRQAMGFDKINILGHSYGGVVAQGYAIKYPEYVDHLIIANSFHSYQMWQANDDNCNHEIKTNYPEVWEELMKVRAEGYVSEDSIHQAIYSRVPYGFYYAYNPDNFVRKPGVKRRVYPNRFNDKLYYKMVGRDGDFYVTNDIGTFDYRKQLKDLEMDILIYAGRFDRVATPAEMIKYKKFCPQAKYVMFERSGHNPQVEQPEECFALIREFILSD